MTRNCYSPEHRLALQRNSPAAMASARVRLCAGCHDGYRDTVCLNHLLPLTTLGEDCPYYRPRPPVPPAPQGSA